MLYKASVSFRTDMPIYGPLIEVLFHVYVCNIKMYVKDVNYYFQTMLDCMLTWDHVYLLHLGHCIYLYTYFI